MTSSPSRTALAVAIAAAAVAACSRPPPKPPAPRAEKLDAVAAACQAPREWLRVDEANRVQVVVTGDPSHAQTSCLFREIERNGLTGQKGLVR